MSAILMAEPTLPTKAIPYSSDMRRQLAPSWAEWGLVWPGWAVPKFEFAWSRWGGNTLHHPTSGKLPPDNFVQAQTLDSFRGDNFGRTRPLTTSRTSPKNSGGGMTRKKRLKQKNVDSEGVCYYRWGKKKTHFLCAKIINYVIDSSQVKNRPRGLVSRNK